MVFERCPVGVKRAESKRGKVVYRARTRKGGQNFSASFQSLEEAMAFLEKPEGTFTPTQVEKTQQSLTYAIDRYLAILRHLYTVAKREWNMDIENPVSQVTRCRESRPRIRFLSDDERQRLLAACKQSHNGYLYPIVMLALSTGMRKMEILNLNWADIDFDRSLVHVRDSKNGEPRAIALTGPILTILRDLRDSQKPYAHCDLVFASPNACRPLQ